MTNTNQGGGRSIIYIIILVIVLGIVYYAYSAYRAEEFAAMSQAYTITETQSRFNREVTLPPKVVLDCTIVGKNKLECDVQ